MALQRITQEQGDVILDIVVQCRALNQTFERRAAHFRSSRSTLKSPALKKMEAKVVRAHEDELEMMRDLCIKAHRLGIDDTLVGGVLMKHLVLDANIELGGYRQNDQNEPEEQLESD